MLTSSFFSCSHHILLFSTFTHCQCLLLSLFLVSFILMMFFFFLSMILFLECSYIKSEDQRDLKGTSAYFVISRQVCT